MELNSRGRIHMNSVNDHEKPVNDHKIRVNGQKTV